MNMNALSLNNYNYKVFVRINQEELFKLILINCENYFYTFNKSLSILLLN